MAPRLSLVIATYNRGAKLLELIADLRAQTLAADQFELIVVDDGSQPPAAPLLDQQVTAFVLTVYTQVNQGPAAARHLGIEAAAGKIVVILDDDMRVAPDFLAQHLAAHAAGATVVLGHIAAAPNIEQLPVFERFHADQLARFVRGVDSGKIRVRGVHLCTGNVSFRRAAYLAVGGFDRALGRSEDRELGVRLEAAGERLVFCSAARSVHASDHADLTVWLGRAHQYGVYDHRISRKHPQLEIADPWRFFFLVSPLSRPLLLLPVLAPKLGAGLSRLAMQAVTELDALGLERAAIVGTTLVYGLEYFRGMRDDAGSLAATAGDLRGYWGKKRAGAAAAAQADKPSPPDGVLAVCAASGGHPLQDFWSAIRADYASLQRYRAKYHGEQVSLARLPIDFVRKVGFQTTSMVRLMQLSRDLRLPLAPQVLSRLLRHLYGVEIHWDARILPGVSIVHGVGLVIGHGAEVGEGCILFHNVTLGEGIDPETRAVGAPRLGRDVHVGPGATLLGPIHVGDGTKIMAGSILTQSVPPRSVVRPPAATVDVRPAPAALTGLAASVAAKPTRKPRS